MFIVQVVPLFTGTETTMSPSRHTTSCCIVTSIHGIASSSGPPGPCMVSLIVPSAMLLRLWENSVTIDAMSGHGEWRVDTEDRLRRHLGEAAPVTREKVKPAL